MGNYFNPAKDILKIGRKISGLTFHCLKDQLNDNEVLFAFSGWFAALVDTEDTFHILHEEYGKPPLKLQYFAVPTKYANNGLDYPINHKFGDSDKCPKNQNTNVQPINTEDDSGIGKDRLCEICKKRPWKIEHRISPPMKVVEVCLCDECSRNVVY